MEKLFRFVLLCALTVGLLNVGLARIATAQQGPNSALDDYAPAFRQLPNGGAELWFTSVLGSKSGRSRQMMVSRCTPTGFEVPTPISDPAIKFADRSRSSSSDVMLNGVPAFTCSGTDGVFVSNRLVDGRDYGNDIYEMRLELGGAWRVTRIDAVNSAYWDDTPSLSADGNLLFFASDRNAPGSKRTDIFYARRNGSAWSQPEPLDAINTSDASEEAPYPGPDGYFYYATNAAGHYQIWRAPIGADGIPTERGRPVPFPGVNNDSADVTHPTFSPGGHWLLFNSNHGPGGHMKDQDIYWVRVDDTPFELHVNVQKRFRIDDPENPDNSSEQTAPFSTTVTLRDTASNQILTLTSDKAGNCVFRQALSESPAADLVVRPGFLSAATPGPGFVSATDTFRYMTDVRPDLIHTLYLWDTRSLHDAGCKQTFPILDIPFFIQGYWGPTTKRYRSYIPRCASFFYDASCLECGRDCESNNIYKYEYTALKTNDRFTFVASRSDVCRECFRYSEFEQNGEAYADRVDDKLDTLTVSMRSALQDKPCIVRAKQRHQKVTVKVTGYTDGKSVGLQCKYSGTTIDFSQERVRLVDSSSEHLFVTGTPMNYPGGNQGNRLLSNLRAYWAACLLDSIWYASVPAYKELRDSNLLVLCAEGKSVNPDAKLPEAVQRAIAVEVSAETEGITKPGETPQPGRLIELWDGCKVHPRAVKAPKSGNAPAPMGGQ